MKKLVFVLSLFLSVCCFGTTFNKDKPADSDLWNNAAGFIRTNNTAMEELFGTDLQGAIKIINVKAPTFGALGDNANDDTSAIQTAITAASAGEAVYFPAGTYLISSPLIPKSGVSMYGDYATIKLDAASNSDMITFSSVASNLTISNLIFDGNRANQTYNAEYNGIAINAACVEVTIQNCLIQNITGRAIHADFSSNAVDLKILNNSLIDYGRAGITINNVTRCTVMGNILDNESVSIGANNAAGGINGNVVTDMIIIGNSVTMSASGTGDNRGIGIRDGIRGVIKGNTIDGQDYAQNTGISCDVNTTTSSYIIIGNHIFECEGTGGIELAGDTDFNIVTAVVKGNILESCHANGIIASGNGVDNVEIIGNNLRDCGGSSIVVNPQEAFTNFTISYNIITDSVGKSININSWLSDSTINGNVITNSAGTGIDFTTSSSEEFPVRDIIVIGNISTGGGAKGFNMGGGSDYSGFTVIGNNFSNNTTEPTFVVSDSTTFEDRNVFTHNMGLVSGTTITDFLTITEAEIRDLVATPKTLINTPGADEVIEFISAVLILDSSGSAYAEPSAPDDMVIEYSTGTDVSASIDATGFIDQAGADEARIVPSTLALTVDVVAEVNASIRLLNTGGDYTNAGTGGPMYVKVTYRVHNMGLD